MVISNQEDFKLIDVNCYYGYWPDSTKPITTIKDVDNYSKKGFSHIFLTSTKALFLNSYYGNQEVIELSTASKQILPVMVLPHHLEEIYDLNQNKEQKLFRSISALNIEDHPWLEYISYNKGIIMVPYNTNSKMLFSRLAIEYGRVSFILTDVNYSQLEEVLPLLSKTKNIYLEMSHFQLCNGIEYLCRKIGAEKIIFGSNNPVFTPESVLLKFNKSEINYESKKLIGRGNIERLLGGNLL